jgi:hypothetical protein
MGKYIDFYKNPESDRRHQKNLVLTNLIIILAPWAVAFIVFLILVVSDYLDK